MLQTNYLDLVAESNAQTASEIFATPHCTGNAHALVFAQYLSDDECTADVDADLDAHAHSMWVSEEIEDDRYDY